MKKLVLFFSIIIVLGAFSACQKPVNNIGDSLVSSKDKAQQGEPILFRMNNTPANNTIQWSVEPNKNVQINVEPSSYNREAAILFGSAGKYTVSATSNNVTSTSFITIDTAIYHCPDTTKIVSLVNDSIFIKPSVFGLKDSTGLLISAITANKYNCLNNYLISTLFTNGNEYTIIYSGVASLPNCQPGKAKAQGMQHIYPAKDGYYIFNVAFNGHIYKGSFTKTGNKYTFTWPYNHGVIISPLVVQ